MRDMITLKPRHELHCFDTRGGAICLQSSSSMTDEEARTLAETLLASCTYVDVYRVGEETLRNVAISELGDGLDAIEIIARLDAKEEYTGGGGAAPIFTLRYHGK